MATVYVEITSNYSRTVWNDNGETNYVIGDRVEYDDGSKNVIFVCIADNNSTTTPDENTSNWVKAGSEEYPFLVCDVISSHGVCNLDDTTRTIGEYSLCPYAHSAHGTNFAIEAAGSQGEVILGDGEYRWTRTKVQSFIYSDFNNVNIKAKNRLKAYIRGTFTRYLNAARAEDLVFVNENGTHQSLVFGSYSGTPSQLISCLITQESPSFKLYPIKQDLSSSISNNYSGARPIAGLNEGSVIKNCVFDFSYVGPSYWFNINTSCVIENNTFYARFKDAQYSALQSTGGTIFKNNIFYYKYLQNTLTDQNFANENTVFQGDNVVYVENPVSAAGGSIINHADTTTVDPQFIDAENGDFSLRPNSPLIGGLQSESTNNNYYLQPGNPYNGDGSQKDASAMTADGDPGPFNDFKEILAAEVPYGSKIIILNGTYNWTDALGKSSSNVNSTNWEDYTLAGYNYVAETSGQVIFDGQNHYNSVFVYKPFGGTPGAGVYMDLDTTFTGIQFNNIASSSYDFRCQITSHSGAAGQGSCTFINCDFLNWIIPLNTSWAGGGRYVGEFSSSFHWKGCNISIAIDTGSAGLFSGEDNLQKNSQHGDWSIENCTFYIHHGITTFNGRNAPNGTYFPLARVFSGYDQSGTLFKNNIVFNGTDGGAAKLGPSSLTSLPKVENNALVGFDDEPIFQDRLAEFNNILNIDPLFVNPDNNDFRLRSNSPLIRGIETSSLLPTDAFYVDFDDGNDSNDGKTLENAFATISAAHDASIHLDTIIIVNKTVSLSANLTLPAGRKYRPLDKCTIDGADTHHILITDSAGLDTHVTGFNFKRLRDTKALIDFSGSDDSSLITFQNCVIEGLLTGTKSSAIGGASDSCRSAREGSLIKGCSFDVGWSSSTITTGGNSCGFVAVDKTDLISCTFRAKDITPLNNTSLFLVGTGGYGAWSHGPPIGPVEVKNCIVHGNDRMNYGNGGGGGGDLGFTSNARVTTASANYVIHSCCLYAIKGDPMAINNSTNLFFRGTVKGDRNIPTESVEDTVTIDPELVDPENGDFRLRPSSKLIGESR